MSEQVEWGIWYPGESEPRQAAEDGCDGEFRVRAWARYWNESSNEGTARVMCRTVTATPWEDAPAADAPETSESATKERGDG